MNVIECSENPVTFCHAPQISIADGVRKNIATYTVYVTFTKHLQISIISI